MDIKKYIPTIIEAIELASKQILKIYKEDFDVIIKSDNSPVTLADKISSQIIVKALETFEIPIISEEETQLSYSERKGKDKIWLVDPIDGTKEFIKRNDQFCICIALIENGKPILGVIGDPVNSSIMFGGDSIGSFEIPYEANDIFNEKWRIKPNENTFPKVFIQSNSHFSGTVTKFVRNLELIYGKLAIIKKGSALKFCDLARGTADFYVRFAPTMEWDIAAGHAIYEGVGGEVLHVDTMKALTYNKPQLKNPYFIAKRKNIIIE